MDTLEPFGATDDRVHRIVISGENVRFPPKEALALSIAFNELATNAVKYGALANDTGSILVEWNVETTQGGPLLFLHWREKDGPPVAPPARKGFGTKMIERGLAHELGGTVQLDCRKDGLMVTMAVPAPATLHG